jgi:hypothetical protein
MIGNRIGPWHRCKARCDAGVKAAKNREPALKEPQDELDEEE